MTRGVVEKCDLIRHDIKKYLQNNQVHQGLQGMSDRAIVVSHLGLGIVVVIDVVSPQ